MKTVAVCNSPFEAAVIKGNLENEGFHPVVFDQSMNSIYPLAAPDMIQVIEVRVPDEEIDAAEQWLKKDLENQAIEAEEETQQTE